MDSLCCILNVKKIFKKMEEIAMKVDGKLYSILKWIAQYLLPALGTLYFALAGIWGLPYGEQVVGTITALDTFLNVVLGVVTSQATKKAADEITDA